MRPHLLKIPQVSTAEPLVRDLVFKRVGLWESKGANPWHILISFVSFLPLTRSLSPLPWIAPSIDWGMMKYRMLAECAREEAVELGWVGHKVCTLADEIAQWIKVPLPSTCTS